MPLDLVIREAKGMSDEALMEVVNFMRILKVESFKEIYPKLEQDSNSFRGDSIRRNCRTPGLRYGQIIMSDDFDAPLDDFREYM